MWKKNITPIFQSRRNWKKIEKVRRRNKETRISVLTLTVCYKISLDSRLFIFILSLLQFDGLIVTSEALFSLLNGDEIFSTFRDEMSANQSITVFVKVYIYVFIGVFIFLILSQFIALISISYSKTAKRLEKVRQMQAVTDSLLHTTYIHTLYKYVPCMHSTHTALCKHNHVSTALHLSMVCVHQVCQSHCTMLYTLSLCHARVQ